MPDYLSPGVYIEELPPQLRAIEGVSTSTAGFVGAASRGAVPGFPLPFTPLSGDPQVVTVVPTPTPVLVTSYSNFTQQFGNPLPLPDSTGTAYLGYAVLGFFNNGGQVLYIARVVPSDCTYGSLRLGQGNVLLLSTDAAATDTTLNLTAVRGISDGSALSFYHKNGTAVMNGATPLTATVSSYNSQVTPVTVALGAPIGVALTAADIYVTTDTPTAQGPTFWARSPGAWSSQIAVTVTPSRRRAVAIAANALGTATEIQVASTAGFYQGAIIEIDIGTQQLYTVVAGVGAGGILGLPAALGVALATAATVRIVEIDINIVDPSLAVSISETFTQLTWNPDPNPGVRQRHYATLINAQSQLVYVQPPGVGGATGSEGAALASQPTTFNGRAFSINSGTAVVSALTAPFTAPLQMVAQAGVALETEMNAMANGTLPVTAAGAAPVAAAATALTAAAATVAGLAGGSAPAPGSTGAALTAILSAASTAANAAVAAANDAAAQAVTNPQTATTAASLANDVNTATTEGGGITTVLLTAVLNALVPTLPATFTAPLVTLAEDGNALAAAVNTMAAGALPANAAATGPVTNAINVLNAAATAAAALSAPAMTAGSPGAALQAVLTTAVNAANAAATAAGNTVTAAEQPSATAALLQPDVSTVATHVALISTTLLTALLNAIAPAFTAPLQAVEQGGSALATAVNTLAGGTLPATAAVAAPVTTAATALMKTLAAAGGMAGAPATAPGSPGATLSAALTTAAATAASEANAAATAAGNTVTAAEHPGATAALLQPGVSTVTTAVGLIPTTLPAAGAVVEPGSDGTATNIDYVGADNGPGQRSGIQALKDAERISIIAAPGQTAQRVQDELINQCELLRYRFAVLDGEQNPAGGSVNAILTHRDQYDTSYAAYYVPWLQITLNNQKLYLPPAGHMAGIYASTDNDRGVWKAPANVVVQNITGLKTYIVKGEQDILNPAGVNVIRRFDTLGIRVWGARTLSSDSSLIYINVRRTLIFLEASIDQGTQWVVFEPNTPDTWERLTDSVTAFLTTQWANGALFGSKPSDAFFVRCDETTMTADDIQNGRLICLIGVAIVRPAEFVIFRIQQITGYANQ